MDYYKPSQDNLHFVYDHLKKSVCIKSDVTVRLREKESLAVPVITYQAATKKAVKTYDHDRDDSQLVPYDYMDDACVEIMNNLNIPYDEHDQNAFRAKLRQVLAPKYEVTVSVNNKPGSASTGGQTTNTISNNDPIEII